MDIVKELVQRQVDLNKCTADGWLPLMIAANRKNCEMMKYIINVKELNVNEVTLRGSALHVSARLGHIEAVKLLLERDADPKTVDDKGRTCLDVCTSE
jgi:ankyrin repeat protein